MSRSPSTATTRIVRSAIKIRVRNENIKRKAWNAYTPCGTCRPPWPTRLERSSPSHVRSPTERTAERKIGWIDEEDLPFVPSIPQETRRMMSSETPRENDETRDPGTSLERRNCWPVSLSSRWTFPLDTRQRLWVSAFWTGCPGGSHCIRPHRWSRVWHSELLVLESIQIVREFNGRPRSEDAFRYQRLWYSKVTHAFGSSLFWHQFIVIN